MTAEQAPTSVKAVRQEITDKIALLVRWAECEAYEKGEDHGIKIGHQEAREEFEENRACLAESFAEAARDAHHQAGHCGAWDRCPDPICAAIERWLHHETRPVGRHLPATEAEALIHG